MKAIQMIPAIVMGLLIGGLVTTAGLKIMANFKSSECTNGVYDDGECYTCPTGHTYNTTANNCYNTTVNNATKLAAISSGSSAFNATENAMLGTKEIANQFTTIGIISAMVIILMLIGGLTAYFGLR